MSGEERTGQHTFPCRDASRSPPGVSCPASHEPVQNVEAKGWLGGVVGSWAIAAPPRSYVNWTAAASEQVQPVGGLSARSEGARLSGVRYRNREGVGVSVDGLQHCTARHGTAHLVVPHDDGNVDEIGTRTIGRKLIMCGVDVRCVAIIVGVPWECQRRFGRIVNARCRRE